MIDNTWIAHIPETWKVVPFGSLFTQRKEKNKSLSRDFVLSVVKGKGVIPYTEKGNVGNKVSEDLSGYKIVNKGDFVLNSMNLYMGSVGVSDYDGVTSTAYIVCQPSPKVVSSYYKYIIHCTGFQEYVGLLGKGIMEIREAVRWAALKSVNIPVPDEETQKEIADFLDSETARIDQLIEKKEKLISLMKERETNAINEKFSQLKNDGCPVWKLGHVCRVQRGKFTHRPRNAPELYDGDAPFIQTGDVARAEKFITQHKQTLSELGESVSAKFPANTLLMAIAANVGNVAITTYEVYCPDSVVGFIPSKKIQSEYLYYTLRAISDDISSSSTSNAQDNTNVARLSSLKIPLPTIPQQQELIQSFKKREELLFKTASVVSFSIEKLRQFRTSLITEAVTGQLDIKAWKKKGGTDKRLDNIEEAMAS